MIFECFIFYLTITRFLSIIYISVVLYFTGSFFINIVFPFFTTTNNSACACVCCPFARDAPENMFHYKLTCKSACKIMGGDASATVIYSKQGNE